MIALCRYTVAVLLRSQRFLPPLMLFLTIAIMFVVTGDAESVVGTYGAVTGALFVCSTWFAIILVSAGARSRLSTLEARVLCSSPRRWWRWRHACWYPARC